MQKITISPGTLLLKEGETSKQMYLLEKGKMRVYLMREGKEVNLGWVVSGELVGELSFLDKNERSANVIAEDECHLIEIPRETFDRLLNEQPPWVSGLIRTLASRLRNANKRVRV